MFQSTKRSENVGKGAGQRRITATVVTKKRKKKKPTHISPNLPSGFKSKPTLSFSAQDSWIGFRKKAIDSIEQEDWLGAFHVAEKAFVMSESLYGPNGINLIHDAITLAVLHWKLGQEEACHSLSTKALHYLKENRSHCWKRNRSFFLNSLSLLTVLFEQIGDDDKSAEAHGVMENLIEHKCKVVGLRPAALHLLGLQSFRKRDFISSVELFSEAVAGRLSCYGLHGPRTFASHFALGSSFWKVGCLQESLQEFTYAHDIMLKEGEKSFWVARTLHCMGVLESSIGSVERGMDLLREALHVWVESTPSFWESQESIHMGSCALQLAILYRRYGDLVSAFKFGTCAVDLSERHCGVTHIQTALAYLHVAKVLHDSGKYEEAYVLFCLSRDVFYELHGKSNPLFRATSEMVERCYILMTTPWNSSPS
eukprot:TRINITY_DN67130_c0_g1_i1.p1 TRINITY_DN67130_c0_g1~~TRINITY_DN67130_c0_g1_i1.p1  ORF type:complete len:425 (-),score=97.03 TRINITY_DN67130_c0_g1_i1:131-1405(-)